MTVTKNKKKEQDRTVLPEDFDPMEMAAFLDGEANTEMVRGLTESPALRAVAAAGLDQSEISDVAAAARLADRAAPLAPRRATAAAGAAASAQTGLFGLFRAANGGADWRATAAGVVLGLFGFGVGLAGGMGIGGTGLDAEEVLISASAVDLFALESDAIGSNDFDTLFGSLE